MTADLVISQLLLLDAEDSERDITLFINSPGGSITAGMAGGPISAMLRNRFLVLEMLCGFFWVLLQGWEYTMR